MKINQTFQHLSRYVIYLVYKEKAHPGKKPQRVVLHLLTWAIYTATNDSGKGPNLLGLIIFASEPFSTYL